MRGEVILKLNKRNSSQAMRANERQTSLTVKIDILYWAELPYTRLTDIPARGSGHTI